MCCKNLLFCENMPDKVFHKYKYRFEMEVETVKKFARITRIDKVAASLQRFANEHRNLFLAIVFGIVICCFTFNIYRIALVCNASSKQEQTTATQRQEKAMDKLHGKDRKIKELEMKYEKLLKEKAEQEKETSTNNKSNTSNN